MLRNTIALFVVVALVAPVVRADDKDKAIEKDKKALQGVWLVESAQQDGKEVPKNVREQSEFCLYAVKVTDDKFQVAWLKDKTDYGNAVAFKLDPDATP